MSALSPTLDTDPHPTFEVYSAGNFAEVAPDRLSVMAWSLVGDPVERGNRALARRLWPNATWYTGSHYAFVGYFNCRPYHNLATYCHIAEQLPVVTAADATSSYFEDHPVPPRRPGLDDGILARVRGLPRLAREALTLRSRLTEVEGRIAELEMRVGRILDSGNMLALGEVLGEARTALDDVWGLHYSITMQLVPLRAIQRRMGKRLCEDWDALEPWVNVPDELVWGSLYDTVPLDRPLGPGDFLDHGFYEVADDRAPWSGFRTGHSAAPAGVAAAVERSSPRDVAWQIERPGSAFGLEHLTRFVGQGMSWREMSKSLSMRCLHLFRRMLPRLAEIVGVADEDWPYLTIGELSDAHLHDDLAGLAAQRRAACEEALLSEMPELLDFSRPGALAAAAPERLGRGVSAGCVTGVVVCDGAANGRSGNDPRILVCDSVDADVEPALPHIDGIVTARGSALSHVAILMREHGIPAVVGHSEALRLKPGQTISINGTTGEVRVLE